MTLLISWLVHRTVHEMVNAGAGLCIAVHRLLDEQQRITKNCARHAIEAGIPTYLIDSDEVKPKRLREEDDRLK
jgi:hypothetical protein